MYGHFLQLVQQFDFLGRWQKRGLALWCLGVLMAESCQLSAVADALVSPQHPSAAALLKRLSRFLSNPRISDELLSQAWVKWVVQRYALSHWVVLVDETKLGEHLAVMMVGLAYRGRAIPLLWRCYLPKHYPEEGQVAMLTQLLTQLRLLVPTSIQLTVQADRGIGTSPDLIRALDKLQLMYLLRVQGQVRLRLPNGSTPALASLVTPGQQWYGRAEVFKKAGWLRLYVCVEWRQGEKSPWCLVTNSPWRQCRDYALRAWHEHSFRDLKSFGFGWQASHVWRPDHAHRLLFILTLAYSWLLSQAVRHTPEEPLSPSRKHPRHSLFRRGLVWFRHILRFDTPPALVPDFCFSPQPALLC